MSGSCLGSNTASQSLEPAVQSNEAGQISRCCCECSGSEITVFWREPYLRRCQEPIPSPFPVLSWIPQRATDMVLTHDELRGIIRRASEYHGIPQSILAAILQNENNPSTTTTTQLLQMGERMAQGFMNGLDHAVRNTLGIDADDLPDLPMEIDDKARRFIRGSAGITNMSDATLNSSIEYTLEKYCKNPIASVDRYAIFGIDRDIRITGYDVYADLYYCAAHIRQNIDLIMRKRCYQGALTDDDARRVLAQYNGPVVNSDGSPRGNLAAERYGNDALNTIIANQEHRGQLYFYG